MISKKNETLITSLYKNTVGYEGKNKDENKVGHTSYYKIRRNNKRIHLIPK